MVGLQVGPEQLAKQVGQALQRGEVHGCLPFAQVVDQHVADWLAGDVVAVDQLLACRLPPAGEHPHRRGRVLAEGTPGAQQLVEQRAAGVPVCPGADRRDDLQQLDAVADGDAGREAALGGHDDRDLAEGSQPGKRSYRP